MACNTCYVITHLSCWRIVRLWKNHYLSTAWHTSVSNGIARTETGSLAGSTLKLIDGIQNLRNWSNRPLHEIWHRGSLSPAASIGKADKFGSIKKGKAADYVVLDSDLTVIATAVDGVVKYVRDTSSK